MIRIPFQLALIGLLLPAFLASAWAQVQRPEATARASPRGGFDVMIVGSGSPRYDPDRARPSALVRYGEAHILVDMGIGTERRLREAGIDPGRLDALLFTHHHIDHNAEFASLLVQSRVRRSGRFIAGPPGTAEYAQFLLRFYAEDMRYRGGRTGQTLEALQSGTVRDLRGGESFMLEGLQVRTARVPHTIHAVAFRFAAPQGSIVISGDLTYSDELIALAKSADVLVIDSGNVSRAGGGAAKAGQKGSAPKGGTGKSAAKSASGPRAHASLEEFAEMAQKAAVSTLVLTHIAAPSVDEPATLARVRGVFQGKVLIARDLMVIEP